MMLQHAGLGLLKQVVLKPLKSGKERGKENEERMDQMR